jgi:GT2 family glycosyltransferase
VLVSSGENIEKIVSFYSELINITHIHTQKVGQSNQKFIGISSLATDIEWVFFLDDDLLLIPDTVDQVLRRISQIKLKNIAGIGTQIMPFNNSLTPNDVNKVNIFKSKPGQIMKSGRAISYQNQIELETEWLNGASIWNRVALKEYKLPVLNSKYAAYEDVIFSTRVNKLYKLIYDPQIKIVEQVPHSNLQKNLSTYMYINLWTGYFVCVDERTRIINFKFLLILRMTKFIFQKLIFKNFTLKELVDVLKFNYTLIKLPSDKIKSKEIILKLLKNIIDSKF